MVVRRFRDSNPQNGSKLLVSWDLVLLVAAELFVPVLHHVNRWRLAGLGVFQPFDRDEALPVGENVVIGRVVAAERGIFKKPRRRPDREAWRQCYRDSHQRTTRLRLHVVQLFPVSSPTRLYAPVVGNLPFALAHRGRPRRQSRSALSVLRARCCSWPSLRPLHKVHCPENRRFLEDFMEVFIRHIKG